jgi:hypothetical protein
MTVSPKAIFYAVEGSFKAFRPVCDRPLQSSSLSCANISTMTEEMTILREYMEPQKTPL